MFIGLCTIDLHIPDSQSLKSKRHVLRSLKDRVRKSFNVAVAEDAEDLWQRTTIAVATVNNDKRHINKTLDHIICLIRGTPSVEILDYRIEII
ncbi:MAG: DUF503 domain-containing protein [Nitrospirota bacterium]